MAVWYDANSVEIESLTFEMDRHALVLRSIRAWNGEEGVWGANCSYLKPLRALNLAAALTMLYGQPIIKSWEIET